MNDQQVRCFLAVAECLSFTSASKQLFLSQASISRNIATLEQELGFPLFHRDSRSVSLSPSGTIMFDAMKEVHNILDKAKKKAKNEVHEEKGVLSVAFLNGQLLDDTINRALARFEARFPGVDLQMTRGNYRFLTDSLQNNAIDLVEIPLPAAKTITGVDYMPVCLLDTLLIMPRNHRHAGVSGLCMKDFSEDSFIIPTKNDINGAEERLRQRCRTAGFEPNIILVQNIEAQLFSVERNKGVVIANPNHIMAKSLNVYTTTLTDYPAEYFVLVWNKENDNRFADYFRAIVMDLNPPKLKKEQ